jgi:hypothetical protein
MADYNNAFKNTIYEVLQNAEEPLTWTEIKNAADLPQKVPNNQWVHRMEQDIGLVRERTGDRILWKLN